MNTKIVAQLYDLYRASAEATLKAVGVDVKTMQDVFLRDAAWSAARRKAIEKVVDAMKKLEKG